MRTDRFLANRSLARLAASATAVGAASLLLVGVLQVPAGAAGGPATTDISVASSPTTPVTGGPVTFTATVSSPGHSTPGGTVTFSIVGADSTVVNCDAGNQPTLASGVATCSVSGGLEAGSAPYSVTASYADTVDSSYKPSTRVKNQNVNQGRTTTVVTTSATPLVTGEAVEYTAAVSPTAPAVGAPSGTVTFSGVTCDGGTNVAPVSGGLAQCDISEGLTAQNASYDIGATYSGDSDFSGSVGSLRQAVGKAAAEVTLATQPDNCTGDICQSGQGTPLSFTATVASTGIDGGTGVPPGSIDFTVEKAGSSTSLTCDGGTNSFPVVNAQATCNFAGGLSSAIYYAVTATLVSTGYAATSATVYMNSGLAGTDTTISSIHGIGAGESITVTATVTPVGYSGGLTPTGYVNVLVCGNNSNGSDGCQGGASPVGVGGVATFTVGGGEYPGEYSVSAIYTGDDNFYSSTAHNRNFVVGLSDTTLNLSEYGGFSSESGNAVTLTATVDAPDGAAGSTLIGPMTGTITFTVTDPSNNTYTCASGNVVTLATAPDEVEGTATCFLPPGTLNTTSTVGTPYAVVATYSGDSDYRASRASATQLVVPDIS